MDMLRAHLCLTTIHSFAEKWLCLLQSSLVLQTCSEVVGTSQRLWVLLPKFLTAALQGLTEVDFSLRQVPTCAEDSCKVIGSHHRVHMLFPECGDAAFIGFAEKGLSLIQVATCLHDSC